MHGFKSWNPHQPGELDLASRLGTGQSETDRGQGEEECAPGGVGRPRPGAGSAGSHPRALAAQSAGRPLRVSRAGLGAQPARWAGCGPRISKEGPGVCPPAPLSWRNSAGARAEVRGAETDAEGRGSL